MVGARVVMYAKVKMGSRFFLNIADSLRQETRRVRDRNEAPN